MALLLQFSMKWNFSRQVCFYLCVCVCIYIHHVYIYTTHLELPILVNMKYTSDSLYYFKICYNMLPFSTT